MNMFKSIAITVGLVLTGIVLVAVGSGLLVLLAYGVGLVVNRLLHFDPFQVTALSLASVIVVGWLAGRFALGLAADSSQLSADQVEADEDKAVVEDNYPPAVIDLRSGLWRPVSNPPDFSTAQPDDRCPCGSRRKFKNCHGAQKAK